MTPSRDIKIRGIQEKRYNKEIFASYTGSVWFLYVDALNPG